jgi:hypothetical protein
MSCQSSKVRGRDTIVDCANMPTRVLLMQIDTESPEDTCSMSMESHHPTARKSEAHKSEAKKERQRQYWRLNKDSLMAKRIQRREDVSELEKIRKSERESSRRKYKRLQTEVYVCDCCSVEISLLSKYKHVKGMKHLKNMKTSVITHPSEAGLKYQSGST